MSTTRLTNSDFSRLISENKFNLTTTNETNSSQRKEFDPEAEDRRKLKQQKKRERAKKYFAQKKLKEQEATHKPTVQYRDRAKEIREGKNLDFEIDIDLKKLGYEWTQYLGGDVKHTHLVKGLDRNLLKQVKENLAKKQEKEFEDALDESLKDAIKKTEPAKTMDNLEEENRRWISNPRFGSTWARNIHKTVFSSAKFFDSGEPVNEIETHGKHKAFHDVFFEYDLSENCNKYLPISIIRSTMGIDLEDDDLFESEFKRDECMAFTPLELRNNIKDALEQRNAIKSLTKSDKIASQKAVLGEKRKLAQISNETETSQPIQHMVEDEVDFDIFSDVSDEYICDPDLDKKNKQNRHVKFGVDEQNIVIDPPRKKKRLTSPKPSNHYFEETSNKKVTKNQPKIETTLKSALKKAHSILGKKVDALSNKSMNVDISNQRFAGVGVLEEKFAPKKDPPNKKEKKLPKRILRVDGLDDDEGFDYGDDEDYMGDERFVRNNTTKSAMIKRNINRSKEADKEWNQIQELWKKGKGKKLHKS